MVCRDVDALAARYPIRFAPFQMLPGTAANGRIGAYPAEIVLRVAANGMDRLLPPPELAFTG